MDADPPYAVHIEFQASYDADMDDRTLQYNVAHRRLQGTSVRSVVFLLRRSADGPAITGQVGDGSPGGEHYLGFRYRIVRVWELSPDALLAAGIGTLPLLF